MKIVSLFASLLLVLSCLLSAKPIAPPEFDTPDKRLFFFVCSGNIEGIDAALAEGADINSLTNEPNSSPNDCFTALQVAILRDDDEVFEHLLSKGADIHVFSKFGNANALSLATIYDRREMVLKLLDAGADPNAAEDAKYIKQYSAIAYAALYGHVDVLKLFAARGGDLERPLIWTNWPELPKEFPLLSVAAQHGGVEVVRYLVEERGHGVNPVGEIPVLPPLGVAVRYNNMEVAKYLISKGADVNALGHDYYLRGNRSMFVSSPISTLCVAARYGRIEMIKLLFAHGARVRQNIKENEHPLYWADRAGYYRVIEEFEKQGYTFDYGAVIQRQIRPIKSEERNGPSVENSSEFTPTFLKGHRRQWETVGEVELNTPLRLAVIADERSAEAADLLTVALSGKANLELIERSALDEVLREQKLNRTGLTSGETLSLVSGLLDAQALILIETLTVNKKQVYQLRLVNSILGLQFGRHFIEKDDVALNASLESYAGTVGDLTNTFRRNYEEAIPLSLVNVRSDLGTLEGLKIENTLKQLLELRFLGQPSVILTQRENLETLIREKDLGGREEELKASSLFVDVGVELDASGEITERYTVRIQPASGESFTFQLAADSKSLNETASEICRAVIARIEVDYAESDPRQEGMLSKDAETYFKEALWHFNLGQYDGSLQSIRTAISLGYDERDIWDYYFRSVALLIDALRKPRRPRSDDASNRALLALERERLIALEGLFKMYRSDIAEKALRAPKFGNYARGWLDMKGFVETFVHFRPVAMQRKYSKELKMIEHQFLRLINEYTIPSFTEPKPHGQYPFRNYPRDFFQVIDLMTQLDESEYEKALNGLVEACLLRDTRKHDGESESWHSSTTIKPPVAEPRWLSVFQRYIDKEGTWRRFATLQSLIYSDRFDYDNVPSIPISTLSRKILASRIQQAASNANRSNADISNNNAKVKSYEVESFLGISKVGNWAPKEGAIPLSFERIKVRRNFSYRSEEYEGWLIKRLAAANKFNDVWSPQAIQHQQNSVLALSKYKEGAAAGEIRYSSPKRIKERIHDYEARIAKLSGEPLLGDGIQIGELPIRLWNPTRNGFSGFEPGSRLLHVPISGGDAWWVLAAVKSGAGNRMKQSRYALLKVNPETLETQPRWLNFSLVGNEKVAMAGKWMAMAAPGKTIKMIHIDSMESKELSGYIPTISPQTSNVYLTSNEGRFFFFVQPESLAHDQGRGRKDSDMQILLRYDPQRNESEVVFNTRRNPPQTILDGTGSVYDLYGGSEGGFLVVSEDAHGPHYLVDCETLEIRKTSRREFREIKQVHSSELRTSAFLDGSIWATGWRKMNQKIIRNLPLGSISMVLQTRERNERGSITKTVIKAVAPKPNENDPNYLHFVDLVSESERQYIKPNSLKKGHWFGGKYGYIEYPTEQGEVLWGIFKMSDLAEALEKSPEL